MSNKKTNPRYANGTLRRKHRARFKSMNAPCGICRGKLGPIHYDEPSNAKHPLSFVIDEIHPVSKYKEYGYSSARQAAEDWNNLQAAHYYCNQQKSDKINFRLGETGEAKIRGMDQSQSDGSW